MTGTPLLSTKAIILPQCLQMKNFCSIIKTLSFIMRLCRELKNLIHMFFFPTGFQTNRSKAVRICAVAKVIVPAGDFDLQPVKKRLGKLSACGGIDFGHSCAADVHRCRGLLLRTSFIVNQPDRLKFIAGQSHPITGDLFALRQKAFDTRCAANITTSLFLCHFRPRIRHMSDSLYRPTGALSRGKGETLY